MSRYLVAPLVAVALRGASVETEGKVVLFPLFPCVAQLVHHHLVPREPVVFMVRRDQPCHPGVVLVVPVLPVPVRRPPLHELTELGRPVDGGALVCLVDCVAVVVRLFLAFL